MRPKVRFNQAILSHLLAPPRLKYSDRIIAEKMADARTPFSYPPYDMLAWNGSFQFERTRSFFTLMGDCFYGWI